VRYDVKVVVYRDISLDAVKLAFPVVSAEKKDSRYVSYSAARDYFHSVITQL